MFSIGYFKGIRYWILLVNSGVAKNGNYKIKGKLFEEYDNNFQMKITI